MKIYIYINEKSRKNGGMTTDSFAADAYKRYTGHDEAPIILRTENGKPFFKDSVIRFSASHTSCLCAIAMSHSPVGIDIQEIRPIKSDRIAERFFTDEDMRYLNKEGNCSFFNIWTRKEAYVKMLGMSIVTGLGRFPAAQDGALAEIMGTGAEKAYMYDIDTGIDGVLCSAASADRQELHVEVITINGKNERKI